MLRKLIPLAMLFFVAACFKAPRDAEYDWQNPNKVLFEGQVSNILDIPVGKALLVFCPEDDPDTIALTGMDGRFLAEELDPGIDRLQITAPSPLYDTILIEACSLKAGTELRNQVFGFRRAVWDMEMEPQLLPRRWGPIKGIWEIRNDRPENRVVTLKTELPYGYLGRLVCDAPLSDVSTEVSMMPLVNNDPHIWDGTLMFCYRDELNYYYLSIRRAEIELGCLQGGSNVTFFTVPVVNNLGNWYRLRIDRVGTKINAFVNGQQVGRQIDDATFPNGRIGIMGYGENPSEVTWHFDDIVIIPK